MQQAYEEESPLCQLNTSKKKRCESTTQTVSQIQTNVLFMSILEVLRVGF